VVNKAAMKTKAARVKPLIEALGAARDKSDLLVR
jgi:hypothetical protein